MTKYCAYCDQLITGEAVPIDDDGGSGAHAPTYWHANESECGTRTARATSPDSRPEPLQRYEPQALRPRSS